MLEPLRPDLQAIADLVEPGSRVLDLGCGDGTLLKYLIKEKQILGRGIELSEAGVRTCVARGLSVVQGDLDEGLADYPDGMFDVVILSQTLPYLGAAVCASSSPVACRKRPPFPNRGMPRPGPGPPPCATSAISAPATG